MENTRRRSVGQFVSQALSFTAILILLISALLILSDPAPAEGAGPGGGTAPTPEGGGIALPPPALEGTLSVEEAIAARRSVRGLGDAPITLAQLSQLLWAAQGITSEDGTRRAAPSAGAKYPLEVFVVAGKVEGLPAGVYRYAPKGHSLALEKKGDLRENLSAAALSQESVGAAPVSLVIAGVYQRTREKYGERAERYVHIEVGAVAENVYLEAESLGLATVFVGAFSDDEVREVVGTGDAEPLGIMPIGARP
jgi:SagB-type dehydrogenase family enzyme